MRERSHMSGNNAGIINLEPHVNPIQPECENGMRQWHASVRGQEIGNDLA